MLIIHNKFEKQVASPIEKDREIWN
jgi:hypothetical protein